VEWVKKWLVLGERLVEIAKVLRKFPWMVEVVRQRASSTPTWWRYVAKDGSEACLSLTPPKAYCTQNVSVRKVKLELEFKRYETYEEKTRDTDQRGYWHSPRRRKNT
jgi:hypothetical protein